MANLDPKALGHNARRCRDEFSENHAGAPRFYRAMRSWLALKWETPMRTLAIWIAACSLAHAADTRATLNPEADRKPAPDFVLLNASGKPVSLSSFKGKPLLLDLWATDCGGCVKEIPAFIEIHHAFTSKGLAVVGISMDILYEDLKGPAQAWSLVNPFVKTHKVDYPILMGDDGITKRYSVEVLPVTYLIDRRGRIAATYIGVVDKANVEENIRALLAER
jgi:peroxiredoxin